MPSTTRERLIAAAQQRFYRDGFRNVGLDQILADVGITKTAFYKHFACKEDLMLEVLESQNRLMQQQLMGLLRKHAGRDAWRQLHAVFDMVEEIINSKDFQGCIFVNAAIEFPLSHDPVYQAAARNKQEIEQIIHDIAERAGVDAPQALAQELCMIMEGAYITQLVTHNSETIHIARRLARNTINARRNKNRAATEIADKRDSIRSARRVAPGRLR